MLRHGKATLSRGGEVQTTTGLCTNDYWFGSQTTIGSLSKQLLVRARSTTGLSANDYCSALTCSIASLLGLEEVRLAP